MDDYFVEREFEAVYLILFDQQVASLLKREKVKIPTFNFILGVMQLGENNILIIEGIHTLDIDFVKDNKYYLFKMNQYTFVNKL